MAPPHSGHDLPKGASVHTVSPMAAMENPSAKGTSTHIEDTVRCTSSEDANERI